MRPHWRCSRPVTRLSRRPGASRRSSGSTAPTSCRWTCATRGAFDAAGDLDAVVNNAAVAASGPLDIKARMPTPSSGLSGREPTTRSRAPAVGPGLSWSPTRSSRRSKIRRPHCACRSAPTPSSSSEPAVRSTTRRSRRRCGKHSGLNGDTELVRGGMATTGPTPTQGVARWSRQNSVDASRTPPRHHSRPGRSPLQVRSRRSRARGAAPLALATHTPEAEQGASRRPSGAGRTRTPVALPHGRAPALVEQWRARRTQRTATSASRRRRRVGGW